MQEFLKFIDTPYIDAQTLLNLLAEYRKPREHILRMVKKGELIRLKNGFYLIKDKELFEKLHQRIDVIDWELAKLDVAVFIADKHKLDIWSKQFFHDIISHLQTIDA